jgi:hypothetical protein
MRKLHPPGASWQLSPLGRSVYLDLHELLEHRAACVAIVLDAGTFGRYPAPRDRPGVVAGLELALCAWVWAFIEAAGNPPRATDMTYAAWVEAQEASAGVQRRAARALRLLGLHDGRAFLSRILAGELAPPEEWQSSCPACRLPHRAGRTRPGAWSVWECGPCHRAGVLDALAT